MNYKDTYNIFKEQYNQREEKIHLSKSGITIHNLPFQSDGIDFLPSSNPSEKEHQEAFHLLSDDQIEENRRFVYPVITGNRHERSKEAIILLHGLNERNWDKYLPWAAALNERTGQPVILFPISFHVNRCPEEWKNPRLMTRLAKERMKKHEGLSDATFLNAAISDRIQQLPQRFYTSGLETYYDLLALIRQIRQGNHPVLEKKQRINFFGYSIGALLTQILLMANPDQLLKGSKAVLFCGGAAIDRMKGASRYILDSLAFKSLHSYYMHLEEHLKNDAALSKILKKLVPGVYFRSMIDALGLQDYRIKRLNELSDHLKVIALKKDQVISPAAIGKTFQGIGRKLNQVIQVMDFPYGYTHENVFPSESMIDDRLLDDSFRRVFDGASRHLAG
jgi:pimeloyl-ACP methyl ester carboxylesterase